MSYSPNEDNAPQLTLYELAESVNATIYELMEFAPDDITRDMTDATEIPSDVTAMIQQAWTDNGNTL